MSYDNDWKKEFDPSTGRLVPKRVSSCTVDSLVRHWKSWRHLNFGDTFRIGTSAQLWQCNAVHRQPDEVSTPAHCGDYDIIKVPN